MAICKKIVWDLGEYLIRNPIYNYEIIDPYLEGCKRYNVYGQVRVKNYSIFQSCQEPPNWINDRRRLLVNGTYAQQTNSPSAFNPQVTFVVEELPFSNQQCNPNYRVGYKIKQYTDSQCTNFTETIFWARSGQKYELLSIEYEDVINNNQPPPIKLKIIDGAIESLHNINDRNSVQIIEYECCPPNTLDCGDCCLDCNSIFNSISNIRKSLSQRIR
ncbi:hypothetical protein WJM97_22795 (plasmid) [Okeanomitos corallinicola TIOX110]|uniref:Uncharacterized protein n=1 Tax=Okeanomitos corallinicola TIOX110 TaxID=3133117 RepID=A0ABZ2V410_9CYAN